MNCFIMPIILQVNIDVDIKATLRLLQEFGKLGYYVLSIKY
jgi:hypothetical protein